MKDTNTNCDSCDSCRSCRSCDSCRSCRSCRSCASCRSCDSCDSCHACYSCDFCNWCKNLRMTEFNLFCYSKKYNDDDSFQQDRYRAFNQVVGQDRYYEISDLVRDILGDTLKGKTYHDGWKDVTSDQWQKLLAIPEAVDFRSGYEFISGVKIPAVNTEKTLLLTKADELIAKANELKDQANKL
jgi:hypothetical protein